MEMGHKDVGIIIVHHTRFCAGCDHGTKKGALGIKMLNYNKNSKTDVF